MNELSVIEDEQPAPKRGGAGLHRPMYRAGAQRSVNRLRTLNFDPILELVSKYKEIEEEIKYQKKLRSGEIVELTASGRPRSYRAEDLSSLYDKAISIGDKLLRYGYGRVPETNVPEEKTSQPLIVNLTKKGETYVANDIKQDDFEYEDE